MDHTILAAEEEVVHELSCGEEGLGADSGRGGAQVFGYPLGTRRRKNSSEMNVSDLIMKLCKSWLKRLKNKKVGAIYLDLGRFFSMKILYISPVR